MKEVFEEIDLKLEKFEQEGKKLDSLNKGGGINNEQ